LLLGGVAKLGEEGAEGGSGGHGDVAQQREKSCLVSRGTASKQSGQAA